MSNCPKCQSPVKPDDRFCPECGHDLKASEHDFEAMRTLGGLETFDDTAILKDSNFTVLEAGTVFADRYEIEAVIGRGGMGVVYKATDQLTKQTVALKLIRPERLTGTNAVEKLIAEGVTARDIRHSNIVAVYDVGQSDGQPFVSMEYLEGQSLRAWHREQVQNNEDIPLRVAARIMTEIMDGLKAAHAAGVIHRDLKPENIILVSEPTDDTAPLKILDFGIARATGAALESGTGTGLGTPRYMAPEQITNADSAGPPADIYSSSVIFYELLVGVLPQGHWQPPSGGRSDVPAGIDALIEQGLSNRPANRAQSATAYRKLIVDAVNIPQSSNAFDFNFDWDPKYTKWGGIAAAAIVGLLLIDAVLPDPVDEPPVDPCWGLTGQDYRDCSGQGMWVGPEPVDPPVEDEEIIPSPPSPPEPPPPPPNPYQALNGQWIHDLGGSGISSDGFNSSLRGQMSGRNGTYTVMAPQLGLTLNGRFVWDGECHLNYQTYDATGSYIAEQGQLHVNHQPGAPCPS